MSSINVIVIAPDGEQYLVPKGTPPHEASKGIPLAIDLSFTGFDVQYQKVLRDFLAQRGLRTPADFEKPGAYAQTADALRALWKVSANDLVDTIRGNSNGTG